MKKKIIILLSVVIILLMGIVVWFNIPLDLMDLDPNEVMEIVVFNGNSAARRQSSGFRISPTINRNRSGYCCNNGNRFSIFPVAKLSRQRTSCPSPNKASHKLEPINPAPPVTKYVLTFLPP